MILFFFFRKIRVHHHDEPISKSSALHAVILSKEASFYDFPDIPQLDEEGTYLLFPSPTAMSIDQIDPAKPVKNIVVLECTWSKCGGMLQDKRIKKLPCIKISDYETTFWRYQFKSKSFLATIEGFLFFF